MFTTINEGLDVYRHELTAFWECVHDLDRHDARNSKVVWSWQEWLPWNPRTEPHAWPTVEHNKLANMRLKLRGMEMALGMTEDEVRQEFLAAGFPATRLKM